MSGRAHAGSVIISLVRPPYLRGKTIFHVQLTAWTVLLQLDANLFRNKPISNLVIAEANVKKKMVELKKRK